MTICVSHLLVFPPRSTEEEGGFPHVRIFINCILACFCVCVWERVCMCVCTCGLVVLQYRRKKICCYCVVDDQSLWFTVGHWFTPCYTVHCVYDPVCVSECECAWNTSLLLPLHTQTISISVFTLACYYTEHPLGGSTAHFHSFWDGFKSSFFPDVLWHFLPVALKLYCATLPLMVSSGTALLHAWGTQKTSSPRAHRITRRRTIASVFVLGVEHEQGQWFQNVVCSPRPCP